MARWIITAALAFGLVAIVAQSAVAVPLEGVQVLPRTASSVPAAPAPAATKPPLKYHDGPVILTNVSHAIYWIPDGYSVDPEYQATLDRYFTDVAADSGQTTNVYNVLTQYWQDFGAIENIAYAQTFAGGIVDTHPFPTNHNCPRYEHTRICITDKQIRTEVKRFAAEQAWVGGPLDTYPIFLPAKTGQCFTERGRDCGSGPNANWTYCAYHTFAGGYPDGYVYAVIPYPIDAAFQKWCGTGTQGIEGNDADFVLDSTSHEHREMINDPIWKWTAAQGWLGGWWDQNGWEGSDKCARKYATPLGTTGSGAPYNVMINGNPYMLQMEWSNLTGGCELS